MTDRDLDSEPPLEPTGVYDLSAVRAQHKSERQARDRHVLVRMNGSFVGKVLALGDQSCTVGRLNDADLWLNEPGVSRRHARIEPTGDGYQLVDLKSANGTYVFGKRVETHNLTDGDLVQFGSTVLFRYAVTDADHERMLVSLYEASVRDSLTGIHNREHFDERLHAELAYARRHRTEVALVMFDLDHFKKVNDTFGHPAGDEVLIQMTRAVAESVRVEDVVARYGGEEFVVILRNIAIDGARVLAERLRLVIEQLRINYGGVTIRITASFGCATLACCDDVSVAEIIAVADRRLFLAKGGGRNRVVVEG